LAAVAALLALASPTGKARAQALDQALGQAYLTNPTLDAARAQLRATDEQVPQALSGQRPTLQIQGQAGPNWTKYNTLDQWRRNNPAAATLQATQPLYRGGTIEANIGQAENQVLAQRANLLAQEQSVLLAAATAYLDVVRDLSAVELNTNNEQVLRRQLQATQDRFRVGEITKTDVSQAEARLAGATAARVQAEGNLRSSRASFARVIGTAPTKLTPPKLPRDLPATLDDAIAQATDHNPAVVAAVFAESAARKAIDSVDGELWPQVSLSASVARQHDPSVSTPDINTADNAQILAQVTIPLYTSGATAARARAARQVAGQRRLQIDEARRQAREAAIKAWEALNTARSSLESRKAQITASTIALEGVRQEARVGTRTVLDTLNAEQELLDAKVGLVQSQHDEAVATYSLLSAVGRLTAQEQKLPVAYYDYQAYYRAVRDRWWGTEISE